MLSISFEYQNAGAKPQIRPDVPVPGCRSAGSRSRPMPFTEVMNIFSKQPDSELSLADVNFAGMLRSSWFSGSKQDFRAGMPGKGACRHGWRFRRRSVHIHIVTSENRGTSCIPQTEQMPETVLNPAFDAIYIILASDR